LTFKILSYKMKFFKFARNVVYYSESVQMKLNKCFQQVLHAKQNISFG